MSRKKPPSKVVTSPVILSGIIALLRRVFLLLSFFGRRSPPGPDYVSSSVIFVQDFEPAAFVGAKRVENIGRLT